MSTLDGRLTALALRTKGKLDDLDARIDGIPQPLSPEQYDAVADNATDDHIAYTNTIAASKALAGNTGGGGFYKGGPEIVLPAGKTAYMGANALDINHTMILRGYGSGRFGPLSRGGSAIRFAAGTSGIRNQHPNTSGDTTVTGDHDGSGGLNLQHLMLQGPEDGVEASVDGSIDASLAGNNVGIDARKQITGYDLYVRGFRGIGIKGWAGSYNAVSYSGDVSLTAFYGAKVESCQVGWDFRGSDTNIVNILNSEAYLNTQAGFVFDVGIGPVVGIGLHTAANGLTPGHLSYKCHYNGRIFAAVWGKTIAELTANAPPNAASDNAYWYYIEDGTADSIVKTWDGVQQFRAGGDIITCGPVNTNQSVTLIGAYSENPGISQFGAATLLINSAIASVYRKGGVHLYAVQHTLTCDENVHFGANLMVDGFTHTLGDNTAGGNQAFTLNLDTTDTSSKINFRSAGGTVFASIDAENGDGLYLDAPATNGITFSLGGAQVWSLTTAGISIVAGKVIKIGGTQVVGARQTGTAANASDLATAITLVNDLKAKLVAHGLIS